MPETDYSSLSGAVQAPTETEYKPDVAGLARRSISIFSRRGTETPEQKPESLSQAAVSVSPTKKMSERQQTWLWRKTLEARKSNGLHQKGTVLKAVPPAEKTQMTRLEREMATSPNEEIMSAISEHLSTRTMLPTTLDQTIEPHYQSPSKLFHSGMEWPHNIVQRTESSKRRDTNTRIGVWVNGVTHWDDDVPNEDSQQPSAGLITSDARFPHIGPQAATSGLSERPNLTVSIPPRRSAAIVQPQSQQRHESHIAPATTVSRFEHAPPIVTVDDTARDGQSTKAPEQTPVSYNTVAQGLRPDNRRTSSSTTSSCVYRSDMSDQSKRSSITSIDPTQLAVCYSDHDASQFTSNDVHKPLPRVPVPRNMRPAPAPPSSPVGNARRHSEQITRSAPGSKKLDRFSLGQTRVGRKSGVQSLLDLDMIDADFIRASPYAPSLSSDTASEAESPTLSQAEHDLREHLGTIDEILKEDKVVLVTEGEDHATAKDDASSTVTATVDTAIHRSDSVHSVMQPPVRAPTVPKRSRKRDWRNNAHVDNNDTQAIRPPPKAPSRRKSESVLASSPVAQRSIVSPAARVHRSESEKIPLGVRGRHARTPAYLNYSEIKENVPVYSLPTADAQPDDHDAETAQILPAEQVLLHILSALTSVHDLFNMAMINKGMYRVFKENELELIKTVTRNGSSAVWEFREWRAPVDDDESGARSISTADEALKSYYVPQRRDETVVDALKKLILENCQTFMRRETALSFAHPHHPSAQRFTDAFWRVWTFCTIFGSRKGREEDITGQLDWLKGGTEANNQSFSATVNTNLDFDMGSVLLNAPEHFAQGNQGGLSAAQLYDMTELWNCLSALLTGYLGQVEEARPRGIFASCGIEEGNIEQEEQMLEEWVAFVLTLGPDVVLKLAQHAIDDPSAGFELAKTNGWTEWTPSITTSRATFLREPAARLYEERIATAAAQMQNPDEIEKKETARKRVAALAAEIRLRRQTSGYKRLPLIDMHSERAMSMVSRRSSAVAAQSAQPLRTSNLPPATRYNGYASQSARGVPPPVHERIVSPLSYTNSVASARPSSPMSQWSSRHISPIIEDRVEAFNRLSLANLDGVAESTVEHAVRKITDMGFTEAQATHALRMTDMGDGLRLDRAVDMLLRN